MLNEEQKQAVHDILSDVLDHPSVLQMKNYIQHGNVTTYDHVLSVAYRCYGLVQKYRWNVDVSLLLHTALLHDFYLYDWHELGDGSHRLHGFRHPARAAKNAREAFSIGEKEYAAIRAHMWPLIPWRFPTSRIGWILTLADKQVSIKETWDGKRAKYEETEETVS